MTQRSPLIDGPVLVIGPGRLGTVLHRALEGLGVPTGLLGRNRTPADAEAVAAARMVLLCVPDQAIAEVAASLPDGPLLAHCSGATTLAALGGRAGFSLHPVMTFTPHTTPEALAGVPAALAGTSPEVAAVGDALATALQLVPFTVAEDDRVAYHASTALASNFLITLQEAAARLLRSAQVDPAVLLPLVRATVENFAAQGPAALTGPIVRGDTAVVQAHREVVADRIPDLLPAFDTLAEATRRLAHSEGGTR